MDSDNEIAKFKWLLIGGVAFLVSAWLSWREVKYLISGKKTRATIQEVYEVTKRGRYGIKQKQLEVQYTFSEADGSRRSDSDTVSTSWSIPTDGSIEVEYTPGKDGRSRLAGHVNWFGPIFLLLSVGLLGFFGFRLWREASEATSTRRPRR